MTKQQVKKLNKKFKSFDEEEQWLMEHAHNGWRLVSYDADEFNNCTYKFIQDADAKAYRYKIDFRDFGKKSDFEDYKELFKETGWTLLSKNRSYSKHIFISTSGAEIFSDTASFIEREIRRSHSAKRYALISFILAIITAGLLYYFEFEYMGFAYATIMFLVATAKCMIDVMRSKKMIKNRMNEINHGLR